MISVPRDDVATLRRLAAPLAALALAAAAAFSAYWQLFTTFRFWDDEGYVLVSVRNFAAGHALYSEVFSQYGPAFNLLIAGLHRICGVPLDTESARWITLAAWVAATLLASVLARRLTGSRAWAVAAGSAVFVILRLLTHEPLHPVGLISMLLLLGTTAGVGALLAGRRDIASLAVGATGALLALVKINVGIFYLAGAGVFVLWNSSGGLASRGWTRVAVIAAAVLAGAMLMYPLAAVAWVRKFILVYAFASTTLLAVLARELSGTGKMLRLVLPFALGAIVTAILVVGTASLAGITPADLWDGVIRAPLRHPASFQYAFSWARLTLPVLALNALAFSLYLVLRWRGDPRAELWVAANRLVVGSGFVISFFHAFAVSVENYLLSFGPGFFWCLAAPLGTFSRDQHEARLLLTVLALFQILHAYPVAGTQVNVGTVLLAVAIVAGLAEVAARASRHKWRAAAAALTLAAIAFPLWGGGRLTLSAAQAYARNPVESFTGANLHLSAWQMSTLGTLVRNVRTHGDVLFSMPGLFSFNLWTNLAPPTRQNITHWWSLLGATEQASIAERLDAAARPVVLVQRNLITSGLAREHFRPSLLTRFIEERFIRAFALDSYELWIRRGVDAPAIGVAEWTDDPDGVRFEFNWPGAADRPAAWLEWIDYQQGTLRRVAATGMTLTATGSVPPGLTHWSCRVLAPPLPRSDCDAVKFLANDGDVLMEVRFPRPLPQSNPS